MDPKPNVLKANLPVSLNINKWKLFISYAFSMWADVMWQFTVALVLVEIGCDLRLPAISGFVNGAAILFFASTLGLWIDKTQRLRAAAACLIVTVKISNISTFLRSAH